MFWSWSGSSLDLGLVLLALSGLLFANGDERLCFKYLYMLGHDLLWICQLVRGRHLFCFNTKNYQEAAKLHNWVVSKRANEPG